MENIKKAHTDIDEEKEKLYVELYDIAAELRKENGRLEVKIQSLEAALQTIVEKHCVGLKRDALEPDKVICYVGAIEFEVAKVYPKTEWKTPSGRRV